MGFNLAFKGLNTTIELKCTYEGFGVLCRNLKIGLKLLLMLDREIVGVKTV
jgi:hypothetical protein